MVALITLVRQYLTVIANSNLKADTFALMVNLKVNYVTFAKY